MKQLFTITLLVISLITTAQNTATPANLEGKDIYALLVNTTPSDFVETVQLTKEQMVSITDFQHRIETLLSNATSTDFDAIVTRDGSTVQLIKYKSVTTEANVPNYFGKEVYFLSNPSKKYKVVATKTITTTDLTKSFYAVAYNYSQNENVIYDAVIISGEHAQYIQYKK
jgi:hypothetical protein